MNRKFQGELTAGRARLLMRMSKHYPIPVPDSVQTLSHEGMVVFDGLSEKEVDIAQFITDMNFRCTIINRTMPLADMMTPIEAALRQAGFDKIVNPFATNVAISTMEEIPIPASAEDVIPLRDMPLVVDVDRATMLDTVVFRLFPKVIVYGAKVTQFNLFSSDPIALSAEWLYPAVGQALRSEKTLNQKFRKMVAGLYPDS